MQPLRRMSQQIAMLVRGAALDWNILPQRRQCLLEAQRAIDDDEFGRLQSALDEIAEQGPPGGLALAAHVLDGEQNLLAVGAQARTPSATSKLGKWAASGPCFSESRPAP